MTRCSTCSAPTVLITRGRERVEICAKPACPGHDPNATPSVAQATIRT